MNTGKTQAPKLLYEAIQLYCNVSPPKRIYLSIEVAPSKRLRPLDVTSPHASPTICDHDHLPPIRLFGASRATNDPPGGGL